MSQYATPPMPGHPAARTTNSLGIAGFVCSLVGVAFTGGLLCPVGLILSLIAVGRQPRGLAIAGIVLGLIGTCGWLLFFVVMGATLLAALGLAAAAVALTEGEKVEMTSDMANIVIAVKAYENENRYLPADLGLLDLRPAQLMDPWGKRYQYHLQEEKPGFDIVSAGEDGQFGTPDDVMLSRLGDAWDPGGINVKVDRGDESSTVRITVGERAVTASGGDDGGTVSLDLGDRVIEIRGDDEGGHVEVVPDRPAPPPSSPPAPAPPATRPDDATEDGPGKEADDG